jgi:Tfp pilus assembly protein PilF
LSQKNSILAKNPNDVAALSARAHNYLRLRNIKAAAQDLDKALKLNPHDEDTLNVTYILVEAYIRDLEEENALHYFDLLIRSLPKESRLYSERGELLHGIGKNNEALADDTRAIELDPTNGPAYFSRGEVKCSLGDMAGAIPDFGKAATLADNKYAPLLRQAECYEVLKDWKNSAINCNKMIALKTIDVVDRLKAVLRRGNDYVEMGDKENALKDFSTVIAAPREATMRIERTTQANEQLTALHGRALIYTERKQYDLAIKDYTRMISNEEEWGEHTPNWYTERANLYRKLGKNDLAKRDEDMAKTWSKAKR